MWASAAPISVVGGAFAFDDGAGRIAHLPVNGRSIGIAEGDPHLAAILFQVHTTDGDLVPVTGQRFGQGTANQSGSSSDQDAHGCLLEFLFGLAVFMVLQNLFACPKRAERSAGASCFPLPAPA